MIKTFQLFLKAYFILMVSFFIITGCSQDTGDTGGGNHSGSSNAELAAIGFTRDLLLIPQFDPAVYTYDIIADSRINAFKFIPEPVDAGSVVKLNGIYVPTNSASYYVYLNDINVGETKELVLRVISENRARKKTYRFNLQKSLPAPQITLGYKGYDIPYYTEDYPLGTVLINNGYYYSFTIQNKGLLDLTLSGTECVDVTGDSAFTLSRDADLTTLEPGQSTTFQVQYLPVAEGTDTCTISIVSNDALRSPLSVTLKGIATTNASEVTGGVFEDFESGILDPVRWIKLGDTYPVIQSDTVYEGDYALEIGDVEYQESSTAKMIIDVLTPATFSFYVDTYTGDTRNKFKFSVNDIVFKEWSSDNDWQKFTCQLSPGINVLAWTYSCNYSYDTGSSYVGRIDNINFESGSYKIADEDIEVFYGNDGITDNGNPLFVGSTQTNFYKDISFTIKNNGGHNLDLSSDTVIRINNDTDGVFSVKETPASVLLPGDTTTFTLTFSPTVEKDYTATIQIASSDPDTPLFSIPITAECTQDLVIIDTFDSGDLLNFPWTTGGDVPPVVQGEIYNNGGYSLELGNVEQYEDSYCRAVIYVAEPSVLSFYYRVNNGSSTSNNLTFSLDGVDVLTANDNDWARHTEELVTGMHVLQWRYYAPSSSYSGAGYQAWIDDITLTTGSYNIPEQDIELTYKGNEIINNSTDNELASVMPGYSNKYCFELSNVGGLPLALTGTPAKIQLSGDAAFALTSDVSVDTLAGMQSVDFMITFTPPVQGVYSTIVSILSDDGDEPDYSFTLSASGSNALTYFDDFENGGINTYIWSYEDSPKPQVQDDTVYADNYALAFGLTNNDLQTLRTKISVSAQSILSFYYKTDTQSYNTTFSFLVDDSTIMSESYSNDWTEYTHMLEPGTYELKWVYEQGSIGSFGAWLDEIRLVQGTFTVVDGELAAYYDNTAISDGSSDVSLVDVAPGFSRDFTFNMRNIGGRPISLTGTPSKVQITGSPVFTLKEDVSNDTLAGLEQDRFVITFSPTAETLYTTTVTIPNSGNPGADYSFTIQANGNSILTTIDDFESGDFSAHPWGFGGDNTPVVQSDTDNADNHVLYFGNLEQNEESVLKTCIEIEGSARISFRYKTNTRYSSNTFKFLVDDVEIMSETYSDPWYTYSYDFSTPGTYELQWRYYRGASYYEGEVWLDDIVMSEGTYSYVEQDIKVYYNGTEITNGATNIDLGNVSIEQPRNITLMVENAGGFPLELTGTPSRVVLGGSSIFDLTQDADAVIPGLKSTGFVITAAPDSETTFNGTISIANNSADNTPFTFSFTCTGVNMLYLIDDFESGDLSGHTWTTGGDTIPFVQTSNIHEGTNALQFGDINGGGQSYIETTVNVPEASVLSFYYVIDAEACCDYIEFYDNDTQVTNCTQKNWTEYTHNVSAGTHVFKWRYRKDGSVSSGQDTGWLDNIRFTTGGYLPD